MKHLEIKPRWVALAALFAFALTAIWFFFNPGYVNCNQNTYLLPRIAHAGGGYNLLTYTDSLEALNANRNHYDLFEIDFNTTQDGEIVCIHDWEGSAARSFGIKMTSAPTFAEFNQLCLRLFKEKNYSI